MPYLDRIVVVWANKVPIGVITENNSIKKAACSGLMFEPKRKMLKIIAIGIL